MQNNEILVFFSKYIEQQLGIVYSEHNYFQLQNRLEEIAKQLNFSDVDALFIEALKGINGTFKQLLLDMSTNNETSFFRDEKIFRAFETLVRHQVDDQYYCGRDIQVWSAACSSGQEALSLAIVFNELKEKDKSSLSYKITGTDISERVLLKASNSAYSSLEVQRGLSPSYLAKYFKNDSDSWVARPVITSQISFSKLNLKDPHYHFPQRFDFIFLRNVLIYQNVEGKKKILDKVIEHLGPTGFLILGSGESLIGLTDQLELVQMDGAVFYRRRVL